MTDHVPFTDGNLAAMKHGAFSPRLVGERAADLRPQLDEVAPWIAASDDLAVEHLATCLARYRMLDEYVATFAAEHGVAAVKPYLWAEVSRAESNLQKALEGLGLNPAGRGKLARDLGVAHHFAGDGLQELGAQGRALRQSRGRI